MRIGHVLDVLDAQGLFEETLFVVTADHGMAPQDIALRANPAAHVLEAGFAAVVGRADDLAARRGRRPSSASPTAAPAGSSCCDNDADASGEHPPVEGAEVAVRRAPAGRTPRELARGRTDANGLFGFATPSDIAAEQIAVTVHAHGFNPRHLLLTGSTLGLDLRAHLYP